MKKIVFTAYNVDMGGIERALINLLKTIDYSKNEVTLILEKKEGIFLNEIPDAVKIVEYKISNFKFVPIRKIVNRFRLIKMILMNYNKFDFACCYATYSIPGSILTRYLSKNNAIWIHSDYFYLYNKNKNKMMKFFNDRHIELFKHIVFVSQEAKENFVKIYPKLKEKLYVCNNLVDIKDIINKSKTKVLETKPQCPLFINIARHQEHAKKLSRLIEASLMLKKDGYAFEVWLVGSGEDSKQYEDLISKYHVQDKVKMMGAKQNPYPYLRLSDALILTSEYEGFPVVYMESLILNKPIITTLDIIIDGLYIKDNYGLISKKDSGDIYLNMKEFIDNKYIIKKAFDPSKYNEGIKQKLDLMISNEWWI